MTATPPPLRPTAVEPWDIWYPKARTAWVQVTPESTDEEIKELYRNVGPVPDRKQYAGGNIGNLPEGASAVSYFLQTLREFKAEFGDSDQYLGVTSGEMHIPYFFIHQGPANAATTTAVVSSCAISQLGLTFSLRYLYTVVSFDRNSILKRLGGFLWESKWWGLSFIFPPIGVMVAAIFGWIYVWFETTIFLNNRKYKGWGWSFEDGYIKSLRLSSRKPQWREFLKRTDGVMSDVYTRALRSRAVKRGTQISDSQVPAGGMNTN